MVAIVSFVVAATSSCSPSIVDERNWSSFYNRFINEIIDGIL